MARLLGNDVSKYQANINWDTYKNNSNFIILKATEGVGYIDPSFIKYQSEARRVGLLLGYYHFARPDLGNSPLAEADYFLSKIGKLREGEILVLDYEPSGQKQEWVTWCKQWLDIVLVKTGVKALIYLNQSQVKQFNWQTVIDAGYGLWIAAYTGDPNKNDFEKGKWAVAAMQQWTNKQTVPGIPSVADGNVFFGDADTYKKYGYKGTVTPPEPTPTPNPIPPVGGITEDEKRALEQVKEVKEREGYGNMESAARGMNDAVKEVGELRNKLTVANIKISNARTILS